MNLNDINLHVSGASRFVDDLIEPTGVLHATIVASTIAHGLIKKIDLHEARKSPGVVAIFTAEDIPGQNQIGNIIQDEVLLAEKEVHFNGQPVALVIAESKSAAQKAAQRVHVEYEEKPAFLEAREAFEKNSLIAPPRTFALGDIVSAWDRCDTIVAGRVDSGAQEHIYLETQASLAIPLDDGGLKIYSATQAASIVQRIVARVLGLAAHRIEVEVPRLGGAFGGKEDQAMAWACLAALAALKTQRPIKMTLSRSEDMRYTGKRHPYSSDYKIGLTQDGAILAFEATYFQNAGAAADLSTAILERTLFHATGSYFIPNVKVTAIACKTNLPPNTAFRGFGAPQAMFVFESAIYAAAAKMQVDAKIIQHKNLLHETDEFPYGMKAESCKAETCWSSLDSTFKLQELEKQIIQHNRQHRWNKKGFAVMPLCFGISFTNTGLNQASALVHVFTDGSVSISTGAVEMGQGVKSKIQGIVARIFQIPLDRIKVEFTNTQRIANMSPTAASTGADMNGHATRLACEQILSRIQKHVEHEQLAGPVIYKDGLFQKNESGEKMTWEAAVQNAYWDRVNLSAHAFYATPDIYFDKSLEKGKPFSYHVYGAAVVEVTVDGLRGLYTIDSVKVVHDAGKSLDVKIDCGQIEGGIVQGLGWVTMEEIRHDKNGRLLSDSLTTYKVPDIHFAPDIRIHFLSETENPAGPFNSKAIGEPPFMYGIAAYFAILNAMRAFKPDVPLKFDLPITPEKVLMSLAGQNT